jgi:hypothetical protein
MADGLRATQTRSAQYQPVTPQKSTTICAIRGTTISHPLPEAINHINSLRHPSTLQLSKISKSGYQWRVISCEFKPISGLFAAGEMIGGLFYFNYPGGTGLMAGAVFGRLAGASAATGSFTGL